MTYTIILAAGKSERFSGAKSGDKLLLPVDGKPIIYYTLTSLNDHPEINEIVVVANKQNKSKIEKTLDLYKFSKVKKVVLGGSTRQESVQKGFSAIEKMAKKSLSKSDIILVHNGANPLPSFKEISEVIKKSKSSGSAICGHKVTSTMKEINATHIIKTHDRNKFFAAQTPQSATYEVFKKAITNAKKKKLNVTDEAMMFEAIGQKTAYVHSHDHNFKITTEADYQKLKSILGEKPDDFIVGIGQDSHEFEASKSAKSHLTLGGIKIPTEPKLKANSDGDVILHALFNAISQALGEKSLGFYADEKVKEGIKDSKKYIELILKKAHKQGYKLNNIGLMLECSHPTIDPISHKIKKSLSDLLSLPQAKIGITATSGEALTPFGKGQAIQCFAIVSLVK
ncbi:MAG: 2-C-methyl-D-erythritol 2,4-cyclodiphosphate synthase [Candidatus Peregrinibacteria bacterium]|nr:2-C-methyl-D-erythritol 2,4-cyclodiphosphate synthase [Candidatus Peregrinibacteria bacterium]